MTLLSVDFRQNYCPLRRINIWLLMSAYSPKESPVRLSYKTDASHLSRAFATSLRSLLMSVYSPIVSRSGSQAATPLNNRPVYTSRIRESDPPLKLGKLAYYRCTNPAPTLKQIELYHNLCGFSIDLFKSCDEPSLISLDTQQ